VNEGISLQAQLDLVGYDVALVLPDQNLQIYGSEKSYVSLFFNEISLFPPKHLLVLTENHIFPFISGVVI